MLTTVNADFSLPTGGGSGLAPGVDLEDKEQLAELLGDNLPLDLRHGGLEVVS